MVRLFTLMGLLVFASCGDGSRQARQEDGVPGRPAPDADFRSVSLIRAKSMVAYSGDGLQGIHQAIFREFDGTLRHGFDSVDSFSFIADPSSLSADGHTSSQKTSGDGSVDSLGLSPIRFRSTRFRETHPGESEYHIEGILELRGHEEEVSFPATVLSSNGAIHILAEIPIGDASEHGLLKVSLQYPAPSGRRFRR